MISLLKKALSVTPAEASQIFDWLWREAGLLSRFSRLHLGFPHLGLQEHLTARYLAVHPEVLDEIGEGYRQTWWREVFILLSSLPERNAFGALSRFLIELGAFENAQGLLRECLRSARRLELGPIREAFEQGDIGRQHAVLNLLSGQSEPPVFEMMQTFLDSDEPLNEEVRAHIHSLMSGRSKSEPQKYGVFLAHAQVSDFAVLELAAFWLARTPVSNRRYGQFLEQTGYDPPRYWRDRRMSDPLQPVVGVNWNDANASCRWLSQSSTFHLVFQLPSEAQWEYAACGTGRSEFSLGSAPESIRSADFCPEDGPAGVGSAPESAGPFGHLDLAKSVWEWCRFGWEDSLTDRGRAVIDPVGEDNRAALRPLRGGSWQREASIPQADFFRKEYVATAREANIGFRVSCIPRPDRSSLRSVGH